MSKHSVNLQSIEQATLNEIAIKILVVDKDSVTRSALAQLLRHRGFEVVSATDGQQALALLQTDDAPGLAIVDSTARITSALKLCRKLHDSNGAHPIHVIMLADKASTDLTAGTYRGVDDYVRKPFDVDELHARLRAARVFADRTHPRIDQPRCTRPVRRFDLSVKPRYPTLSPQSAQG